MTKVINKHSFRETPVSIIGLLNAININKKKKKLLVQVYKLNAKKSKKLIVHRLRRSIVRHQFF